MRASRAKALALPSAAALPATRRTLSGVTVLAIITTTACVIAVIAVVMMIGLLPPEDLAQLGRLAE